MANPREIYLLEIISLTKSSRVLKDPLLYYSLKSNFQTGSIVLVPLRKKIIPGVVWQRHQPQKMFLRQIGFQIQPISQILIPQPVFTAAQLKLAEYLGNYYWVSPGIFLAMMWPFKNILHSKKIGRQDKLRIECQIKPEARQELILFPQINQLKKFVAENSGQFKNAVIFHSQLKTKALKDAWVQVRSGQVKIIIGTRQAIFLPFVKLDKITLNSAENPHYSSWDMSPHYSAKIAAGYLKKIFQTKLIFTATTPTIQDYYLSQQKKIKLKIAKNSTSPSAKRSCRIKIIDLQKELSQGNFSIFSRELEGELGEVVEKNQPALLFLGRRGFSTALVCQDCGYLFICPNCGAPLTRHIEKLSEDEIIDKLICHHCGWNQRKPKNCPICHSYRLKNVGHGAQKIEYILGRLFPGQKIARLDSDVSEKEIPEIIRQFQENKIRFLVATQKFLSYADLILPKVKLAAIVSADTFLLRPDFQAAEELFIFIQQIKDKLSKGQELFIQTYSSQNKTIQWAVGGEFEKFYQKEIKSRQQLNYPPFALIAYLKFYHRDNLTAHQLAAQEKKRLKNLINRWAINFVEIMGPIAGNPPQEKRLFVWRLLIKAKDLSSRNRILAVSQGKVEV